MERNPSLRCMHHWPTRSLCVLLLVLQAASLDYYLIRHLGTTWVAIIVGDTLSISLFVASFFIATSNFRQEKELLRNNWSYSAIRHMPTTYIAWFLHGVLLNIKIGVMFAEFSHDLDENEFFGPNTLKTSIALSGLIFLTFLATQHDVRKGHRKLLIDKLTATVIFDILDGVDSLDILFEKESRDSMPVGLDDAIIGICCINFLLPTVPLFTLAITRFGLRRLPEKYELMHKLALAWLVNLPLLILRMITWHGISQGVSIFTLKNIIVMGVVTFEVLEHRFLQVEEEEEAKHDAELRSGPHNTPANHNI